jgi:disulfide bond formation protein DsbB
MSSTKNKLILNSILILSVVALLSAYFIEYFLGHKPCNLCKIERIPYLSAIILISIMFFLNKFERIFYLILSLVFILGVVISIYHVGIEQGIFSESFACDLSSNSKNLSNNELLKELKNAPVSCKNVTFAIFGISLATINTLISLLVSVMLIKSLIKNEKN